MPFVAAGGLDVHYVEHGPAAGTRPPTAVLLHGFTPDHRLMTGAFEPVFADRPGWRRVYLDLPGMGRTRSDESIRGTDDVLAVVREAIATLAPGRYAVCGQSYGGYLARGIAAAEADRLTGMALVCPMLVAEHARRDVPAHKVIAAEPSVRARLGHDSEFGEVAVVQTEETVRRTQEEVVAGIAIADEDALDRIREDWAGTFPREPEGPPFEAPVLLVTGRQDSSTGYRDAWPLLEHYPRATYAVLDRAGHNAHLEQPALFMALVAEWLDRVEEHQGI